MVGLCEPSAFRKGGNFFEKLSNFQLLDKTLLHGILYRSNYDFVYFP